MDKQRKERFITLLNELLNDCGGVKTKLAQKIGINPSTLTRWFQGKIDPASIDLEIFIRLAQIANLSVDELTKLLLISDYSHKRILDKFKNLIADLLSNQTQEELARKLQVKEGTVAGWAATQSQINPRRISIETIAALAEQKGWNIERLLTYLGLKKNNIVEQNLLAKIRSSIVDLSIFGQIELLTWFFNEFENKLEQFEANSQRSIPIDRTICIILETENLEIASNYASNLAIHLNLKPENIKVTTIPNLPESIADIDILIFDISSPSSANIAVVEDIEFDRDIVVFVDADLPSEVRSHLEDKVTDLVVKPIDWQKLKDKAYFS